MDRFPCSAKRNKKKQRTVQKTVRCLYWIPYASTSGSFATTAAQRGAASPFRRRWKIPMYVPPFFTKKEPEGSSSNRIPSYYARAVLMRSSTSS